MVSRTAKREVKKRKLSSARETAAKGGTFERTSLTVPEGCEFFKPKKAGVYRVDIIPYEVGEGNPNAKPGVLHYERTFYVHRGVGANNESYVCPRKNSGKKCPICEHRAKLLRDPDADEDLVRSLTPKKRQLINVIDKDDTDKGVQVWDESYHLFGRHLDKKIKEADEDDQERYDNFHDPEKGLMLRVGVSEETGAGYTYFDCSNLEFKDRKQQYEEDIIDSAHNLDEMVREPSYAELKKVFLQQEDEKEEDDEDEETDDTEDEDEEEKKPPKKPGKKPKPDGENEGADEPEEETDEEESASDIEVGMRVAFKYRGEKFTGKVVKVRNGLVHVQSKDRDDPHIVDPDDCKVLVGDEPKETGKKPPKAEKKPGKKPPRKLPGDDDEDEETDDMEEDEDADEEEDEE